MNTVANLVFLVFVVVFFLDLRRDRRRSERPWQMIRIYGPPGERLLADGWEPFAVTENGGATCLRRRTPR